MINDYLSLSSRAGFNKSLGHFRLVTSLVKRMTDGENLANIIDELEKERGVEKSQIGPILNAVLIDRMGYLALSFNLVQDVTEFDSVVKETSSWNRLEFVLAYHHPQLGVSLINPKDSSQWESLRELNQNELVVLYGVAIDEADRALVEPALDALFDLLLGREAPDTKRFGGGKAKPAAPKPQPQAPSAAPAAPAMARPATPPATTAQAVRPGGAPVPPAPRMPPTVGARPFPTAPMAKPAAPKAGPDSAEAAVSSTPSAGGKARMTPKYSVQVTNELFHNGNVEAWKNIVESYKVKYPGLDVHIFHDGQKVNNINSLFKWGKVKHGDVILFSIAGENITGVAKLQRYLFEGASQRFENFLKKDVNKVLTLF